MPPEEGSCAGDAAPQRKNQTGDEALGENAAAGAREKPERTGTKMKVAEENNNNDNNMDFDDLLPHVGEFGNYQRILFLLMIPFAFFVAWVYFTQIFITLVPEKYWCKVPELSHLPVNERIALSMPMDENGELDRCIIYDVDYAKILAQNITPDGKNWKTRDCDFGWEFEYSDIPYSTIATELQWVCTKDNLPTLAQSIFFVGAIFGGLIFGWIADRYGRIPALVGSNLVGFAAGISTAFARTFWQFALCRFFFGFAFDNCFTMMYILVLEYVGPKWRTFVANMSIALFFTFASSILPWIAYFLADWKMTCLVTSAPLLFAIVTPLIVPESARWLVSQGKIDKAIEILRNFERINGTKVPENVYREFKESCERIRKEEEADKNYTVLDLFKSPRLRNITILMIIIWMIISLVFDGHVRNVYNLGLDFFVTFTVAAATELPADTFLTLVLDRWGRRWLACGTMVFAGIFSLFAAMVSNKLYAASLAIIGRFSVNISYNIGLQYAAELLPTVVRAQGVALVHIMGYVASILAPGVVYLSKVSPVLPLLVLGILGIIGGLLSLYLPETLNKDLPQTLQDGEDFGKDQHIWDMPCLAKKTEETEKISGPTRSISRTSIHRSSLKRVSLRGETMRSNIIQRSSIRRKNEGATSNELEAGGQDQIARL